ncbi:NnrU family protein [Kiloniella antarctica]|uniref:NnrU family protein n=1 Tax=Kiloniella antarctica TaxID=1550907 RepID=A0ABW5BGU2_9PROT
MGLIFLCGGLAFFSALHLATATKVIRRPLVQCLGEWPYKGIFALLSLVSFMAALHGYAMMDYIEYWKADKLLVLVQTFVLMPVAFVLLISSYVSKGTRRLTRHPMLTGMALACFGHVFVNGDLAGILLFGGLGVYCILAMLWSDIQAKISHEDARVEERDFKVLTQTSYMPSFIRFKVLPQDILPRLGVLGPVLGIVIYGLVLTYHGQVIGVSPLSSLME